MDRKEIKQHKMKRRLIAAVAAACSTGIHAQENTDSVEGFVFTDEISIPVTSVKDQNKSGTCWCFAGTSHLEDEAKIDAIIADLHIL